MPMAPMPSAVQAASMSASAAPTMAGPIPALMI